MSEQPGKPKRFGPHDLPRAQREPWLPREFDVSDSAAVRAVRNGVATEHQQRTAMEFIITKLCGVGMQPFVPGDPAATNLALGRLAVGLELINLSEIRLRSDGEQP